MGRRHENSPPSTSASGSRRRRETGGVTLCLGRVLSRTAGASARPLCGDPLAPLPALRLLLYSGFMPISLTT